MGPLQDQPANNQRPRVKQPYPHVFQSFVNPSLTLCSKNVANTHRVCFIINYFCAQSSFCGEASFAFENALYEVKRNRMTNNDVTSCNLE